MLVVVVVVCKRIHSRSDKNRIATEGLSFYSHDVVLHVSDAGNGGGVEPELRFLIQTVRLCAPCGARCMGHVIRTWFLVCSMVPNWQTGNFLKKQEPFVHGRMVSPNTSPQAIKLDPRCSGQAQSNKPSTSYGYENTEPRCRLAVLRVPFIIRQLRSADARSNKIIL